MMPNHWVCVPQQCHCLDGKAVQFGCDPSAPCEADGAHKCRDCNAGFGLNPSGICKPNCESWFDGENQCSELSRAKSKFTVCDSGVCSEEECCAPWECEEEKSYQPETEAPEEYETAPMYTTATPL